MCTLKPSDECVFPKTTVKGRTLRVTRLDKQGNPIEGSEQVVAGKPFLETVGEDDDVLSKYPTMTAHSTMINVSNKAMALLMGHRWVADPVMLAMGAEWEFDYAGEPGPYDFNERLTHCYRLAAQAITNPMDIEIPEGLPKPAALVHGTWSHPDTKDKPIPHAWVLLDDKRVWEPITATICQRDDFMEYTQAVNDWIYSGWMVGQYLVRHRHWGPWH